MNFGKVIIDPRNITNVLANLYLKKDKLDIILSIYNSLNGYLLEIATGRESDPVSASADVYNITKNDNNHVIVQTFGGTSIITEQPKLDPDASEDIGPFNELPTFELLRQFFNKYKNFITQIALYNNFGNTVFIKKFQTNSFGTTNNYLKNIAVDIKYLEK
jgi:hypothetical protein